MLDLVYFIKFEMDIIIVNDSGNVINVRLMCFEVVVWWFFFVMIGMI